LRWYDRNDNIRLGELHTLLTSISLAIVEQSREYTVILIRTLAADMPNKYCLSRKTGARRNLSDKCNIHKPPFGRDPVLRVRFPFGRFVRRPLHSALYVDIVALGGIKRELLIDIDIVVAKVPLLRNLASGHVVRLHRMCNTWWNQSILPVCECIFERRL
jgi:hypothetical protein